MALSRSKNDGSKHGKLASLQRKRNFGERVLRIFLTKLMAAVFYFNCSGRLGRERKLYQGGGGGKSIVNSKESGRGRGVKITPTNGVLD